MRRVDKSNKFLKTGWNTGLMGLNLKRLRELEKPFINELLDIRRKNFVYHQQVSIYIDKL